MSEITELIAGQTSDLGEVFGRIQAVPQSTFIATAAIDTDGQPNEPMTITLNAGLETNGAWKDITVVSGKVVLYPESVDGSTDKQFIIPSGGNYHNTPLTGNVIVLENTNAQAIFTGFDSSQYKRLTIINNGDFEAVLNAEDANSTPENQIKLPTGLANIGIEGTTELIYVDSINKWQITDAFASKYRPEHRGLTENMVEVVTTDAKSETYPMIDYEVFRDAQSTPMSHADLETAYPTAERGTWVICEQINKAYKKVKASPSKWIEIDLITVL